MFLLQTLSIKNANKLFFIHFYKKVTDTLNGVCLLSKNNKKKYYKILTNKLKEKHRKCIDFIIGITSLRTNIIGYVGDYKGQLLLTTSTGQLNINQDLKRNSLPLLIKFINDLINKINFIHKTHNIILHLHNFKENKNSLIINILKTIVKIHYITITYGNPHNGCRPKKLKIKKGLRSKLTFRKRKTML